jgi:hypothetical protein
MPLAPANAQKSFPEVMAFRKDWRVYQSRLLDHLDTPIKLKVIDL